MKRTFKKLGGLLLALCLLLSLLPMTALAVESDPLFQIIHAGSPQWQYDTLASAVANAVSGDTIQAMCNVDEVLEPGATITITQTLTLDLRGYSVSLSSGSSTPLIVKGSLTVTGGVLNVTATGGAPALTVDGGTLTLDTNDASNPKIHVTGANMGLTAVNGGKATVTSVVANGDYCTGVQATVGVNATVVVKGDVTVSGENSCGVEVSGSLNSVTVEGGISATGISCFGASVTSGAGANTLTVMQNITVSGASSIGAMVNGGLLTVNGNVSASGDNCTGAKAIYKDLLIYGNLTATGTGSVGALLPADGAFNSITINGVLSASTYIMASGSPLTITDGANGTDANIGYRIYSDSSANGPHIVKVKMLVQNTNTGDYYTTLTGALTAAADGDTITLLGNIIESSRYTNTGKTIAIDGHNKTITAKTGSSTDALVLFGSGTIKLKNLTLQGSAATEQSVGLEVTGSINVQSEGTVIANGGAVDPNPDPDAVNASIGLQVTSSGTVNITEANGGFAAVSVGVLINSAGTVNVMTAASEMGTKFSIGVQNASSGTINVNQAIGNASGLTCSGYGVVNNSGTINVSTVTGTDCGVFNLGTGTINATTITSSDVAVKNDSNGKVNVKTITSGTFTTTTNMDVATVALNKGTGASCVLDSITIANSGSTIGTLPNVYKDGACSSLWYTGADLTNLFTMQEISPEATLYSAFYTVPDPPFIPPVIVPVGGGGGGSTTPTTTITTQGSTTTATTPATATSDGNGGISAAVTGSQLSDALTKALTGAAAQGSGTGAVVEIKVDGAPTSTSITTSIPQAAFSELSGSSADGLMITTPIASITFNGAALDEISGKASGDIKITAALADTSTLTDAEKAAVGSHPVYDFAVTSGGATISDFGGGSAAISVPYTLAAGEDPNRIVIYYLSDSGALIPVTNCSYDAETGMVTFNTSHFSKYAVVYNNVAFTDVSGWYADGVNFLAARGIMTGAGGNTFSPEASITRAEFVTILANLSGADLSSYTTTPFSDVKTTDWYSQEVQWAYTAGVVSGNDGKFNPLATITRQDMAAMIALYAEKVGKFTLTETVPAMTFNDSADIAAYAADAVNAMQRAGIISGKDGGLFSPNDNASRSEAAVMIARLLKIMIG